MSVIVFAFSVFSKIFILVHYLGCIFIYIGGENFANYEKDHVPWILLNEDFHDMDDIDLIIFADYWVCTVVTTVGYGDYFGSTSIEYIFTFIIEFGGFIIFAVLEVSIVDILNIDTSFSSFVQNHEFESL